MKKSVYIIFLTILSFVISSCDDLTTLPTDRIIEEYFWKTEDDALKAVNAIYSTIPNIDDYGILDTGTESAWYQLTGNAGQLGQGSMTASYYGFNWGYARWTNYWVSIQRSNYFLDNIDKVKDISDSLKKRLIAEAKYIRALNYSEMYFLWNDIPLVTTSLNIKNGDVYRTPRLEVRQFVIDELIGIVNDLPEKYDAANIGRVTKGAVKALLLRVYMHDNMYSEAKLVGKDIIENSDYQLYPSYSDLFKYVGENCSEIIFDKQYISTLYKHSFSKTLNPRSCYGSSSIVPLKNLVDSYEMVNGRKINDPLSGYDPNNPYENRDPRLKATILTPGATMINGKIFNPLPGQNPVGTDAIDNGTQSSSPSGYNFIKYSNVEDLSDINNCSVNGIIMRYAEVLLSYAEAKIETNDIDQSVLDAINDVRARAYGVSREQTDQYPTITTTNKNELREIVRNERKIEFVLEGVYYFDIRRWKTAEEVMPGQTYGMTYSDEDGNLITVKTDIRHFDPSKDYYWPIPESELNVNPNMTQNPGY